MTKKQGDAQVKLVRSEQGFETELMRQSDRLRVLARGMAPALIVLTLGMGASRADMVAAPDMPAFTRADLAVIERNEALKQSLPDAPWLVYKILRALEHPHDKGGILDGSSLRKKFDGRRDPDLAGLERTEPEAAHDLFLLLKKAKGGAKAEK
jgi:hypothetical protein